MASKLKTKYLPTPGTNIYNSVVYNLKLLTEGRILVIDPSIGSLSSMPGYAVYDNGLLLASGVLKIDPKEEMHTRLKEVYRQLRNLSKLHSPDLCIYEDVPVSAHGGRSAIGHASLLKAVGVTMAAVDAREFLALAPSVWKKRVGPEYVKSDEQDAITMGFIAIEMAKEYICINAQTASTK